MLLPSVQETLAPVGRHSALESAISALGRSAACERLAGLTETAKGLVAARAAPEQRRPVVVLAGSSARADALASSAQFFYDALAGPGANAGASLPGFNALPLLGG